MFALSNPSLATQKVAVGGRQVRARRAAPTRRAVAVSPKARLYDNILETIGDTPIVKINRLAPEGVTMYAKAEFFNPCSSVKDRYVPVRDRTRVRFSVSRPIDAGSDPHRPRGRPERNHTRDDSRSSPFALFRRTLYSAKSGREPKTRRFHLRGRLDANGTRTRVETARVLDVFPQRAHERHRADRTRAPLCVSDANARTRDSLALAVITDAERRGVLKKGDTVVEATSGNTGIAVAMVCAQRGYDCVICMAEPFSVERRKIMRMLGAKVIVTPKAGKGTGMVAKAEELCAEHGWFLCSQFENDANPAFHASTTGPEILQDFAGKQLDYFVTGYGTGGTFQGVGRALKAARPDTKIVLLEPEAAGLIASGVTTERKPTGAPAGSHPAFAAHPIQGWTPDFIPKVLEDAQAMDLYDELVPITGPEAIETAQKLARMEGIFTGISGGASMAGALKVAEKAPKGSVILTMLPDTSERYMSTPLYESIAADMNEEELEIAKSTPSFQLLPDAEPILQA